jgi:hypothetical protein
MQNANAPPKSNREPDDNTFYKLCSAFIIVLVAKPEQPSKRLD